MNSIYSWEVVTPPKVPEHDNVKVYMQVNYLQAASGPPCQHISCLSALPWVQWHATVKIKILNST